MSRLREGILAPRGGEDVKSPVSTRLSKSSSKPQGGLFKGSLVLSSCSGHGFFSLYKSLLKKPPEGRVNFVPGRPLSARDPVSSG